MDNYQVADCFSLLAKLMDIHGENSFKAKSYSVAAFAIENLPVQLSETPLDRVSAIKGIGESTGKKIVELMNTGALKVLQEMIDKTPPGILEMMNIKGIGPKKIATIWKEMEIESIGELLYACKENRLKLYKGFGEKTQQNIIETIEFYLKNQGNFLYRDAELIVPTIHAFLKNIFYEGVELTGCYTRQMEFINELEFVIKTSLSEIEFKLSAMPGFELLDKNNEEIIYKTPVGMQLKLYSSSPTSFIKTIFKHTNSPEFALAFEASYPSIDYSSCIKTEDIFSQAGSFFIPPYARENAAIITKAKTNNLPDVIQPEDIRGIIHSHSNWSDGNNTIEEMALAAMNKGMEYLVISDHSKSAFYAQGLSEERIKQQHHYIDELNMKYSTGRDTAKPFRIFKSIECDILNDGKLDYSDGVLATFDLIIASVHANLKMTEEKAMSRLLAAIENPFTTILGHMTGRLLLSRKGYPVDHRRIIDASASSQVVIELNAHPSRLDIDWRHIEYAIENNVILSIDPDAHSIEGFDNTRYGVLVAQKGMLTKYQNLSSFGLTELEIYLLERKKQKKI